MADHVVKRFDEFAKPADVERIMKGVGRLLETNPYQGQKFIEMLKNDNLESWRIAAPQDTDGRFSIYYVTIKSGRDFPTHLHDDVYAVVYIVEGKGHVVLDGETYPVTPGVVVHIPPRVVHEFIADGPLSYIAISSPDFAYQDKPDFIFT